MDDLSQIRRIRNIGVAAHIDAGKTTTTERLLYYSGRIHRSGDVDDGTTTTDFDVEEQQRGITIYSAAVTLEWNNHRINLIDTPGHVDFTAEVERSLRVLDGAVVVFDAKEGVEAQSETVWRQADRYFVPRMCFINKMDKTGADFDSALASIRDRLHGNPIPIHLPTGSESSFNGFIDLVMMKKVRFHRENDVMHRIVEDIPADWLTKARGARHALEERVAELDDGLMDHYLTHESLADEQLVAGLRKGTIERRCQPVLCGSSLKHIGARDILNRVCDFLPSPVDVPPIRGFSADDPEVRVERPCDPDGPLAALVFKVVADAHSDLFFVRVYSGVLRAGSRVVNPRTGRKENIPRMFRIFAKRREQVDAAGAGDIVAVIGLKETLTGDTLCEQKDACLLERIDFPEPVISMSIEPKSSADRDKLIQALEMLSRSDPTFSCRTDTEAAQLLISGMGELHLEVMCHRLERDFNVGVRVGKPRVAYRETITVPANAEGRFIREAGGRRHFAVVYLRLEPFTPEAGQPVFQFVNQAPAGLLKREFLAAVESAARSAAQSGPLGSYPLINVRAVLTNAEEHPTDSTDVAFETATALAVNHALEKAAPVLLEPIMKVEVVTPDEYFGAINSDMMSRRATITGTHMRGQNHVIDCEAPLSAMFGYSTAVRSLSQGRASYAMEPCRYEAMPPALAQKVLGVM